MLAIIPARGGSKGLPGKNIKLLAGKPLLAYTIEAALKAKDITRVIISTDSDEIAKIAIKYGAECPFLRPSELSTDSARSVDVYKHAMNWLQINKDDVVDSVVILQPTSPLRTNLDIDKAISIFYEKNADSVVSYCQEHHPIKWHKYITPDGKFENIFEESINNRQLERPSFFPNGAIYIFKRTLIETEKYYTAKSYAYIMDRRNSIDIDTLDDFEYVEFLLNRNTINYSDEEDPD
ncbi:acylneuraminate cytidylyltransferase family protein [Olivibacter domesticus]|uniref:N-acylneuraminate cytidylyltransferase n=1 Tax=Olivibacter domesticus TaxID=407022 RepID=A0A1H7UXN3_OLID1|nr:acylneuraminate cytidylyltransferase family protein [Olivibacter domesticus]SEM01529.1 N-acylneuraminate cytidylyltransferase [Olivibacter domesticus]